MLPFSAILPIRQTQFTCVQGKFISYRRTPKIIEQYDQIGGKSPIGDWTRAQGKAIEAKLDKLSPDVSDALV